MDDLKEKGEHDRSLRARAEKKLATAGGAKPDYGGRDPLALIHELQVHQIELEMQNEELRRAHAEADLLRARYQDLYNFAPVGYLTLDRKGSILEANQTCATMLGVPRSKLANRPLAAFLDADSGDAFELFRRRVFAEEGKQTCEVKSAPNQKPPRYFLVEGVSDPAEGGGNALVALIDTTELKENEAQINGLNRMLAEKTEELVDINRGLESFCATIVFELRRPLTYIYSAAQLLNEKAGLLSSQDRKMTETICKSCKYIDGTISTVFKISKSAFGPFRCQLTDLSRLAADITSELHMTKPDRKAVFIIKPGLTANCDPELLKVVLDTLLRNAWEFTTHCDVSRIEFGITGKGRQIAYYVRDNGIGFDEMKAKKLFVPFPLFPIKSRSELSGIGLATARRIIQRHGGRLWAEGKEGKGATFFFTLPDSRPTA